MNNIIQISDLKCPSKELECALVELFAKFGGVPVAAPTSVSGSFNPATNMLTVTVNGVVANIDMTGTTPPPTATSNLGVVVSSSNMSPTVGDTVVVTIDVTNSTGDLSPSTVLTVTPPAGLTYVGHTSSASYAVPAFTPSTWNLGSMAVGATASLSISYVVAVAGSISLTADIAGGNTDSVPANNSANVTMVAV